ncbi:hypothetical protein H0A36_02695 [Endozoicomonas sp. SM1973]|uniref:Uncharacterized protein n=1 Tax=Spartinivicinus marinus TaxID=2994442 RepID=A0A853HWY8_9GAMM|nr:hypothetical protein [Spartinivicinus marinus]MCX4029858.1 hypothetical protein [Spartinivicinus marinus]NYZ64899.1 hypothetical protein [Spartinivicinus marinus]
MSVINKRALKYIYHWKTKSNDSRLKGNLGANLFNKHEGYEVLSLINKIAKSENYSKDDALVIEKLINRHFHANNISQSKVSHWIKEEMEKLDNDK